MRKMLLIGLAAAALGGCGQGVFGLGGVESPHRRLGYWEETRTGDMSPTPMVTRICLDAVSDKQLPVLGRKPRRAGACQTYTVTKTGNAYVTDAVCGFGGVKMTRHTVLTGNFTTSYTAKSTITIEGASNPARNGAHATTLTALYKGDCPADLQPGQVQLPDGEVRSIAEMRGGFGGLGGGGGGGGPGGGGGGGGSPGGGGRGGPGGGGGPG
jgi:hypothetical protein